MADTTRGMVCAHHHLYSTLARGMPAPPKQPTGFGEILEQVWWRLDAALDLDMIRASALLGATEALMSGTTAIVDHHESPNAIEGSLDVIAEACAEVGVRVVCAYGVTDRHGPDGARRGLAENERFVRAGGRGLVGVHAAFTCTDETLASAAGLAADLGVGVHIHVAEGPEDRAAGERLASLAADDWLLVHCVLLDRRSAGHDRAQPALQHEQRRRLRRARPSAEPGGARHRRHRRRHARRVATRLRRPSRRRPERLARRRRRRGSSTGTRSCPRPATTRSRGRTTTSIRRGTSRSRPASVPCAWSTRDGGCSLDDGRPTLVDVDEVRAKAAEQADAAARSTLTSPAR